MWLKSIFCSRKIEPKFENIVSNGDVTGGEKKWNLPPKRGRGHQKMAGGQLSKHPARFPLFLSARLPHFHCLLPQGEWHATFALLVGRNPGGKPKKKTERNWIISVLCKWKSEWQQIEFLGGNTLGGSFEGFENGRKFREVPTKISLEL